MNQHPKSRFWIIYFLAILGDLADSLLLVGCIVYATHLGSTEIEIGIIGAAYGFTYFFMPAILGRMGDRNSRKRSLQIATLGLILVSLLYLFFQNNVLLFIIGRMFTGILNGFFWPTVEAYISEQNEDSPENHRRGIANFCLSWGIGFTIGPYLAGVLSDWQISAVFYFGFTFYCIAFLLVLILTPLAKSKLKERKIHSERVKDDKKQYSSTSSLLILLFGMILYSLLTKLLLTYFPHYAILPEGLNWSGTLMGNVILIFGIGRTLFFILGRWIISTYQKVANYFIVIGLCILFLYFIRIPWIIAIDFGILGFSIGAIYMMSLDLLLKQETNQKGSKAGLFESAIGLGNILSPILAGLLASISFQLPFIIFSLFPIALFGIYLIIHMKGKYLFD